MKSQADYLQLITSEHRDKPLFQAAVATMVEGIIAANNVSLGLIDNFDLDQAIGAQLDAIGLWVGVSRFVPVPIIGVYMEWDNPNRGWEMGYWRGPYDPLYGISSVDDATYRTMIRAKIAANIWDGTLERAYDVWTFVFGTGTIFIQDNMDMTITVLYDTTRLTQLQVQLLTGGYFKMKPAGVRVNYVALTSAPIFSWDRATIKFQGWTGSSVWV